ncbi:MAG: immunity 53 family protein [Propionibacteriaceae bacterium]|nr:immunity 53 family protein [Propionibacteriaceae bacterium]
MPETSRLFDALVSWFEEISEGQEDRVYQGEDERGLLIDTLDNPGWRVQITGESGRRPIALKRDGGDNDWIFVTATDRKFEAWGDTHCLNEIMLHAVAWLGLDVDG